MKTNPSIKAGLAAVIMAIYSSVTVAQEATTTKDAPLAIPVIAQTVTEATQLVQFDAQYEDSSIKVYITKVFPEYHMKDGQLMAVQTIFLTDLLKNASIPQDSHRIFHSVSDETAEMYFTPIIAGTRAGIAKAVEGEAANNNANKVVGVVGAVAMFALTRGTSGMSGTMGNLEGLKGVTGSGMLKSANFQDQKIGKFNNHGIDAAPTDIIYVSKLEVKYNQKEKPTESSIYFVMPIKMHAEVFSGKKIIEFQYGEIFKGVLGRAILKSANLIPSSQIVADKILK